jgi:hypothetical protein
MAGRFVFLVRAGAGEVRTLAAVLFALVAASVSAQTTVGPAPSGDPAKVARQEIQKAEHPCPRVVAATRVSGGGIAAKCSNGEDYLIASMSNPKHGHIVVAMRCSAARKLGITGC